jgi:hypothetical protein
MGRSRMDSSKDRSQRWAAQGWNPGFYHTWGIPWPCEQLSTSFLKGLSKTTEASLMIDGLRTGIWKKVSPEHITGILPTRCHEPQHKPWSPTKPQISHQSASGPCDTYKPSSWLGLNCITSTYLADIVYPLCCSTHTGLSGYKAPFSLRKFPILGLQRN